MTGMSHGCYARKGAVDLELCVAQEKTTKRLTLLMVASTWKMLSSTIGGKNFSTWRICSKFLGRSKMRLKISGSGGAVDLAEK